MKRQFKFRVWYKLQKRFLEDWEFCLNFDGKISCPFLSKKDNENEDFQDNFVIQQFTGYFDNKNQIFEGDIVTGKCINKSHVIFYEGKFVTADSGDDAYFVNLCESGKLKVIGNIFENR